MLEDFDYDEEIYELDEIYGDRLNKKLRREKNTVLYGEDRNCAYFGIDLEFPINPLIENCKGVFLD